MKRDQNLTYEEAAAKLRNQAGRSLEGGLEAAVSRAGGELHGFSIKIGEQDYLMSLRATFPAGRMIAFVGADSMAQCFTKAAYAAGSDTMRWRVDKYARSEA
jgi:hypothetical protein